MHTCHLSVQRSLRYAQGIHYEYIHLVDNLLLTTALTDICFLTMILTDHLLLTMILTDHLLLTTTLTDHLYCWLWCIVYTCLLYRVEEEEKQKPVKVFQSAGGVWNAYGTQQVLGWVSYNGLDKYCYSTNCILTANDPHCRVTSQAQPISEDVVLSEVEPPQVCKCCDVCYYIASFPGSLVCR